LDTWNYATSTELWIIWYKEGIEEALFAHRLDIFSLNLDLMLFDIISIYFGEQSPEGLARGHRVYSNRKMSLKERFQATRLANLVIC